MDFKQAISVSVRRPTYRTGVTDQLFGLWHQVCLWQRY